MSPARQLPPEIVRLEQQRWRLVDRLRWLAPNSRRGRDLRARQTALTLELLRLEVALETSGRSTEAEPREPELPLDNVDDEGVELKWFQR